MITRYLAIFIAGAIISFWVETLRWNADVSAINLAHTRSLKAISDKAFTDLSIANERANKADAAIALLDTQHLSELSNALADNQKLSADVAIGTRRVRIAAADLATCQLSKTTASRPSSLGNAAQIELTPIAGQNILAIRAGIIADQAKLDYLQDYIKALKKTDQD